jgi:alpha-ketoglutarate-dependent taurine dioxygenase
MKARTPATHRTMPWVIEADGDRHGKPVDLGRRVVERGRDLDQGLLRTGAVLLRGFGIANPDDFHQVVASIRPQLRDYVGGDSPRKAVGDRIYTSTEFPPDMEIGLHNELSYTSSWPERVFFCCLTAAQSGGQTHIADGRQVFACMDPAVRERFSERGVIYRQHLRDSGERGPGKSWQETFDTTESGDVERICSSQGMDFRWTSRGFQTSLRNPGVLNHPESGETCWFNQADLWHRAFDTVKAQEFRTKGEDCGDEMFGSHACYGDGSEIPIADLKAVRSAYEKSEMLFIWQAGDLLILDNVLAMHGRKPFKGERKVLVAMA